MDILIVCGSQRTDSMSLAVGKYIQENVLNQFQDVDSSILDLSRYRSLLDHYGDSQMNTELLNKDKELVLQQMYACDAVIIIAPEWGGMIPPALVNLLLMSANGSAGGLPFGHKPAFAIGISASGGGSNPISLLKAYTAKNSHLAWLPLHSIINNVDSFVSSSWLPGEESRTGQVQSRLLVGLKALTIYAQHLAPVREELVALSQVHPFGQ